MNPNQLMPHDKEAEQAMLGAIFINPNTLPPLIGFLSPEDFFSPSHRDIYQSMIGLSEESSPIDEITVSDRLRVKNKLEQSGGVPYLAELRDFAPAGGNNKVYAEIILRHSQERQIMEAVTAVREGKEPLAERVAKFNSEADRVLNLSLADKTRTSAEVSKEIVEYLESEEEFIRVRTHTYLDNWFGRFEPGFITIVAARPKGGKTTFGVHLAIVNAKEKLPGTFISLEMTNRQLYARVLCNRARIDTSKIIKNRGSKLTTDEYDRLAEVSHPTSQLPINWVYDGGGMTVQKVGSILKRHIETKGIQWAIIDHFQELKAPGGLRSDYERQSYKAQALKRMAASLGIPIILLAQINRDGKHDSQIYNLKGTGDLEQICDLALILNAKKDEKDNFTGELPVNITARDGGGGKAQIHWEPAYSRIGDYGHQE